MRKPNFFIIGAPKCGTTSMALWLREHPNIFMTSLKEPHYFNLDHPEHQFVNSLKDYERLFREADEQHAVVGESSVGYLYFPESVPNILKYASTAHFLVMVRNPIDMAYSMHSQRCLGTQITSRDFATEWRIQAERVSQETTVVSRKQPRLPPYGKMCRVGEQLRRLYSHVPRERVHIIVFDDLKADPGGEYRGVLNFLGIADDKRVNFLVENAAKKIRSVEVAHVTERLVELKNRLGILQHTGIGKFILKMNSLPDKRPEMALSMCKTLREYFHSDIQILQDLLSRDLSNWLAPYSTGRLS